MAVENSDYLNLRTGTLILLWLHLTGILGVFNLDDRRGIAALIMAIAGVIGLFGVYKVISIIIIECIGILFLRMFFTSSGKTNFLAASNFFLGGYVLLPYFSYSGRPNTSCGY